MQTLNFNNIVELFDLILYYTTCSVALLKTGQLKCA